MNDRLAKITIAVALAGVLGHTGAQFQAMAQTIPQSPDAYLVASDTVMTAGNVTWWMLGTHTITADQAQSVADDCQKLRLEIAKGQANPTDAQLTYVTSLVDALQVKISGLAHPNQSKVKQ